MQRYPRTGEHRPVDTGGHRRSVFAPQRDWLFAVIGREPGIALEALSRRFVAGRGVRPDTGSR